MPLPRHFCWTRFGTEAGETIEQILTRKEQERRVNGGLFLWGIGNAIGPSMRELVRRVLSPEVVFSPIRSKPRKEDIKPVQIVAWTGGRSLDGCFYELPCGSIVTSRVSADKRRQRHYALVCSSVNSLGIKKSTEAIPFSRLRNLLTNRRIGASQVTAVVSIDERQCDSSGITYSAAIRADLVYPYFIELIDPVPLQSTVLSTTDSQRDMYATVVDYLRLTDAAGPDGLRMRPQYAVGFPNECLFPTNSK